MKVTRHFIAAFLALAVAISSPIADAQTAPDERDWVLDCTLRDSEGILAPQQSLILDVLLRPTSPNIKVPTPWTLQAELKDLSLPSGEAIASFTTQIPPNVPLPLSFVTPNNEGIYEISLTAVHHYDRTVRPLGILPVSATTANLSASVQRQFIVLGSPIYPRLTGDWTFTDSRNLTLTPEYRSNDESSADSPSRRLLPQIPNLPQIPHLPQLPNLPSLPRVAALPRPANLRNNLRNLSLWRFNQNAESPYDKLLADQHTSQILSLDARLLHLPDSQGHFSEQSEQYPGFSALSHAGTDGSTWFSLPMNTERGKSYLVEIDYPVNVPQTFGIAVVEDLSSCEGYDGWSGIVNTAANIHVAEEIVQTPYTETVATHRLLFWAVSEQSDLVLVNRQPNREALFRNIRISQVIVPGQQEDRRLPKLFEGTAKRKRIGQILGGNNFPFFVSFFFDTKDIKLREAYEGCTRLLDTLSRGGYDGVTLTVLSKESSLFPAENEAVNLLEIMFRRFDSEELLLIPAIEFDMPLPSLEQLVQQYPAVAEAIYIGNPEHHQYNLLSPTVQHAMAETVLELVDRFGHHHSFGGVAIVLSPDTYAQLPFALLPPDDRTWSQFKDEAAQGLGIPFPSDPPNVDLYPANFAQSQEQSGEFMSFQNRMKRVQFLRSDQKVWETWVRWRAAKVSGFYADLAQRISDKQVSSGSGDVPLYLLGGTMLDQPGIQQFCAPTLPRNFAPLQAIQMLGFDLPLLSQTASLAFLKPVIVSEERNYSYDGLDSVDTVSLFSKSGMLAGVQFVHGGTDTQDYFVTTPAHNQSRKRFVRQLAKADVLMFMDAGVTLPFGQEPAQFDLLDTYRQLPPVPFKTFQPTAQNGGSLQPLTIRYHNLPDGMIVYIVNDASFAVDVDFFFTANLNSTISELTGHRMIRSPGRNHLAGTPGAPAVPRLTWRTSLLPYDLLAIKINDANAKIESVTVHRPPSVDGALRQTVEELGQRVHAARGGVPLEKLVNADFELPPNSTEGVAGWQCFGNSLTALVDHTVTGTGQGSVKLTNNSAEPGTFLTQPFDMSATGRLDVLMSVGVLEDTQSLPMSVVLSAKHREQPLFQSAPVEKVLMPLLANTEPKNGVRWHRVIVPFRLPLEPLEEVRIGVQYSGIGTVWIDDVTVSVLFTPNEIVDLQKTLSVADTRCSSGRVSELISLLEGHWAQYLFEHVPAPIPQPVSVASRPSIPEVTPPLPPQTLYQRVRGLFGGK